MWGSSLCKHQMMGLLVALAVVQAAGVGLGQSNGPSDAAESSSPVLRVGETELTRRDYDLLWKAHLAENPDRATSPALLRGEFHRQLIDDYRLMHQARQERLDRGREYRLQRMQLERKLLIELLKKEMAARLKVGAEEVANYYRKHLDEFTEPARTQVRLILTDTQEKADEVLQLLKAGGEFAELAREHSNHPSKASGGSLPYFTSGTYAADFESAVAVLEVGETSGVLKTELGFHIIEKTSHQQERVRPLAEVEAQIAEALFQRRFDEALAALRDRLRRETPLEINFPNSTKNKP